MCLIFYSFLIKCFLFSGEVWSSFCFTGSGMAFFRKPCKFCRCCSCQRRSTWQSLGFHWWFVRACCRPSKNQRIFYNGHKRVRGIKFQRVTYPNGLIANLFGPVRGTHNTSLLAESNLQQLQQHWFAPDGSQLCIFGDRTYHIRRPYLLTGFRGNKQSLLTGANF